MSRRLKVDEAKRLQDILAMGPLISTREYRAVDERLALEGWIVPYDGTDAYWAADGAEKRLYDSWNCIRRELLPEEWL